MEPAGQTEQTTGQERQERQERTDGRAPEARAGVARLLTVGVGGAGSNAVNRMIEAQVRGVEFAAMNTDAQALGLSRATTRLRLGETLTRGLGAGGNPDIGRRAAEESAEQIAAALAGADMVFITAGMGGGTGTGAGPLVAQTAREQGALAVAVVTTPFAFERRRKLIAEQGIAALREVVDALIVVPNERLMQLAAKETSVFEAYRMADDVLRQGIQGISDLITIPGLINLDFADIKVVMRDAGSALMAMGQASGEDRAEAAVRAAIGNPLLDVDISGARGVIFNITGGDDLTMQEVNRIADIISGAAHPDANIIFGTVYDPSSAGAIKITVVATGFEPRVARDQQRHPWLVAAKAPAGRPVMPAAPRRAEDGQAPARERGVGQVEDAGGFVRVKPARGTDGAALTPLERRMDEAAVRTPRDTAEPPVSVRPRPTDEAVVARRPEPVRVGRPRGDRAMPGFHGEEYAQNDEPEEVEVPRVGRSRWERFLLGKGH